MSAEVASLARARCRALVTAGTVISRSSAVSAAERPSTCVRSRLARWRGGRCCSAATNANRMLSRSIARSAGSRSPAGGSASASGIGSIQCSRGRWESCISAVTAVGLGSTSNARYLRSRPVSMSRHTLVAMRYSHVPSEDRSPNPSRFRHARKIASCTASSASTTEPSMR